MWKRAVTAVILALAISPALASESQAGPRLAAAVRASDVVSASQALTDRRLSTRPDSSERKIDEASPSTLNGDERRAALVETQAEFLKAVWTN